MSETIVLPKKRRAKKSSSGKYRIRARIDHKECTLDVEDYGTFAQMYKKYGDKCVYFCADVLNELGEFSHRLDTDMDDNNRLESSLDSYGRHRAWIQPGLYMSGKKVILVRDAAGLLGVALIGYAADIIDDDRHRRLHRMNTPHRHLDGNLKHRAGEHHGTWRTRKDGRRYRR